MLKEILFGIVIIIGVLYFVDNLRWFSLEGLYTANDKFCLFDSDCYPSSSCTNMVAAVQKYGARNITVSETPVCKCMMRGCVKAVQTTNSTG